MTTQPRPQFQPVEADHAWMREELRRLQDERMPRLAERLREIQRGAPTDDLYAHLARQELARVRDRIVELERMLARGPDGDTRQAPDATAIGREVEARDEAGRVHTFVIVSPVEADAARGYISAMSPVGAGLLGRRPGECVTIAVPTGTRTFTVLNVA